MAQSGFAALFLFLGLVVSDVYGENATICETILNATLSSANLTDFKLTVSPTTLLSKTDYTVSLEGTGNFTIFLQASSSSNPVGNWSQDVTTCKGSPLFNESFPNGKSINTTWTSPENVTSVTISAYIQNDTETFRLEKILIHVSNETTSATTVATTSATVTSHTESTQTAKVSVATSADSPTKTTNAGPIEQSSLLSMALSVILSLLLIPNERLS